jgi:MFS family permease
MIMAAGPVGWVIGGVVFSRFVSPAVRQKLIRPLAIVAPLALVPSVLAPRAEVVALLTVLSGIAQGAILPTLNSQFVLALRHGYRARAFAVIQGGVQLAQGFAVITTGILAEHSRVPTVVGLWSVGGVLLIGLLVISWPSPAAFERAIALAARAPEQPAAEGGQPHKPESQTSGPAARPHSPRHAAGATRITPDHG